MSEYWERKHNESWIARWRRLTGNVPEDNIKATKFVNCGAVGLWKGSIIVEDADKLSSQVFKVK